MKNGNAEGILILVGLILMALLGSRGDSNRGLLSSGETSRPSSQSSLVSNRPAGTTSGNNTAGATVISPNSPYTRSVSLNIGNVRNEYQPSKEYVTVRNSGREAVNITGWQLANGKGERTYYLNGELRRFPSDVATIGQGTLFLSPTGANAMRDIVLERGETAIITTGRIGSQLPYPIVSFKENMCTGYLETAKDYAFTPALTRSCPRPADEVGLENLDTECRRFVERLPSCRTPDLTPRNKKNEICNNCVNGTPLSNACVAFIKERFTYQGCAAFHAGDENFYKKTWRVFLNQNWEMWGTEYEKVRLLDGFGRPVAERSYK